MSERTWDAAIGAAYLVVGGIAISATLWFVVMIVVNIIRIRSY